MKKWRKNNAEEIKKKNKEWYKKNRERVRENTRLWRERNPLLAKKYSKKYYVKNREKIIIKNKEWWGENKESTREYIEKWREKNKGYNKKYYEKNKEKLVKFARISYRENKDNKEFRIAHRKAERKHYNLNREKIRATAKKNYPKYRERQIKQQRIYMRRMRKTNLKYKITHNMGGAIRASLKRGKNGRKWESLVRYTCQDLMNHLESQFESWMTWDNYGLGKDKWSIDHIIPISSFNYESYDDLDFKKCWALNNLCPLDWEENIKKGNKILFCTQQNVKQREG